MGPYTPKPDRDIALRLRSADGHSVQIVVLSPVDSLALWKERWQGRERIFLARAGLLVDGDALRLTSDNSDPLMVSVFPAPPSIAHRGTTLTAQRDGMFQRFTLPPPTLATAVPHWEKISEPGPAREIKNGPIRQAVPQAPNDAEFAAAAVWRIKLPATLDLTRDPILRFHYRGDVARVMLNGRLIADDFYNGNFFDLGVRRFAPESSGGELRIAILPLRKDAPIFLAKSAVPDFGAQPSIATLERVELVQSQTATVVSAIR